MVAQTRTSVITPDEFVKSMDDQKWSTEELLKRKEGRAKLTTEHKVFILKYVSRHQQQRLKAAEVRDELHRVFGGTQCSYFSLPTIRLAMKRMGFSYRRSSVRPPLAYSHRNQ